MHLAVDESRSLRKKTLKTSPGAAYPRMLTAAFRAALMVFVLLTLFDVLFVPFEKDEGFYAYAFRLVAEGRLPYRDFTYIESPALPYYYVPLLLGPGITLRSVRVLCALTGLTGLLILLRVLARRTGPTAASVAGIVLFSNPYLAEWFSRDVTYPLVNLLLALAVCVARSSKAPTLRAAGVGILLAFLGAVKVSMGIVSLIWIGLLLWQYRRSARVLIAGVGAFVGSLAVSVAPFWIAAPRAFIFNVLEVPLSRGRLFPFMRRPDPLDHWIEIGWGQKIFAARTIILWNLPLVLLAFLVLCRAAGSRRAEQGVFGDATRAIGTAFGAGVLFHLLIPSPAYPNYFFMLLPLLALPVAARYAAWVAESIGTPGGRAIVALPIALAVLHLLGYLEPGRVGLEVGIWRHGPQRDLIRLVARTVPPGGLLLTDYLPVAVQANRRLIPGSEGGRASWVLDLPDDRAAALRVLNRNGLLTVLREGRADGVVLTQQLFEQSFESERGFESDAEKALASRYALVREFPASVYFQYGRIRVFRLKAKSAEAGSPGEDYAARSSIRGGEEEKVSPIRAARGWPAFRSADTRRSARSGGREMSRPPEVWGSAKSDNSSSRSPPAIRDFPSISFRLQRVTEVPIPFRISSRLSS